MDSKYQRIISQLTQQIKKGQLKKGDKLPSIRLLSQTYHCSKDTVQRALLELRFQNLIYAIEKSGYYVLEGQEQEEETLQISLTDYNNVAYQDFKRCMTESLVNRENYLFNYYHHGQGLAELLTSLKHYLARDAIYAKENHILVTSGTQQALYILTQLAFPNKKDTILLEQPTYHRMIDLIHSLNLPYEAITRSLDGIDLTQLEYLFKTKAIKFFYTISRFSNPLGLSYTTSEKAKIIELAKRYDVYIVEDDYMGDFTKSVDLPLHYYDTSDHVIYLKSFSMTLFSALRLGVVILPEKLLTDFLNYKTLIDYDTNLIMQKALSLYLDNGMFAKNTHYLQHVFQKQMRQAETALAQSHLPFRYTVSPLHIILEIPPKSHLGELQFTEGVSYLETHYLKQPPKQFIQLKNDDKLEKHLDLLHDLSQSRHKND